MSAAGTPIQRKRRPRARRAPRAPLGRPAAGSWAAAAASRMGRLRAHHCPVSRHSCAPKRQRQRQLPFCVHPTSAPHAPTLAYVNGVGLILQPQLLQGYANLEKRGVIMMRRWCFVRGGHGAGVLRLGASRLGYVGGRASKDLR
jgi:hypothetical protein